MSDLDAALDAALERKTNDPHTATARVTVGKIQVRLKFTELESTVWAACRLADIPRQNAVDAMFGFNVTAAAIAAAPLSGVQVVGKVESQLSTDQWSKILTVASAADLQSITDAVIAVNEDAQMQRLVAAKKAFEGASKQKQPSPEN